MDRFLWSLWLKEKGELLAGIVLGVLLLSLFLYQIGVSKDTYPEKKAQKAEILYQKWISSDASLENVKKLVDNTPGLSPVWDTLLIQADLAEENSQLDLLKASSLLTRLHQEAPYYNELGKISLLIQQGFLQEALTQSQNLQTSIQKDPSFPKDTLLQAYNTLRIAVLAQKCKDQAGELAAWKELEEKIKASLHSNQDLGAKSLKGNGADGYFLLYEHLSSQGLFLLDYRKHCR